MCKKKMCPFQHDKQDIIESEVETNKSDNQEKTNADINTNSIGKQIDNAHKADEEEINVDSDSERDEFECDLCGKIFVDENELDEHESSDDNCGYGCEECGAYYRDEIHLKMHLGRHCTKCFDEFTPKNVLEAHKKTCLGLQY